MAKSSPHRPSAASRSPKSENDLREGIATPAARNDKIDANQLLQDWKGSGLQADEQRAYVRGLLALSQPLIVAMAEQVGNPAKGNGAIKDEDDRRDAVMRVVKMARLLGEEFKFYEKKLAKAMGLVSTELRGMVIKKKGKGGEDDDDAEPIITAGGWIQKHLVELWYDPERLRTGFSVRYPNGDIDNYADSLKIEGRKYVPIPPTPTISKNVVLLPSGMGDEMQEHELLAAIRAHIDRYFDFGSDAFFQELTPFWVLFTYSYDGFMEVSYLRGLGDYGTGKTRFLKAVGKICYRPVYMSGGSSAASIYHLLDQFRGTLVLNEADFGQSDEASIIAKILNGGTERGEGITRMKRDATGNFDTDAYDVFGPKLIVTRKSFDDKAIESRCLTMEMVPFSPHPRIPQSLPPEFEKESLELRNLLLTYRMHHAQENIAIDQGGADRSLEPRLNQVTMSLMSIVKEDGVKDKIRQFLQDYNERTRSDRKESKTARVIEGLILANAWGAVSGHPSDVHRVYLKDVASAVNQLMDEMRRKMGEEEEESEEVTTRDGRKFKKRSARMTSRSVSGILKSVCQLRVRETTDGTDEYRGTNEIVWDEERVRALCERWGVAWKERGSEKRPVVLDLNKTPEGLKKFHEEYEAMKFEEPTSEEPTSGEDGV